MLYIFKNQLHPQVDKVLINANRNHKTYQQYGEVVADDLNDFQGPLAGIHTAMQACKRAWIVAVPCDGIFIADDLVTRLYQCCKDTDSLISVAHDGHRLQPVHAMIHCSLHESLGIYLAGDNRKIDLWYSQHSYARADFSDYPQMFKNVNTPSDRNNYGVP